MKADKDGKAGFERENMTEQPLQEEEETRALDFLEIDQLLSPEERDTRSKVRRFVQERILPEVDKWFEDGFVPGELAKELGDLGVLGAHLSGYGCAGHSAVQYGLECMELEAGDSGIRTFVSVQGSLAMSAIWKFGSEEQKQRWLPGMAAGELIGCFALTEPRHGSDPASMETFARRDGNDWVLNGSKRWIGNGTIADVAVVWAQTEDGVRGFLVPANTSGFSAREIKHKMSMRASMQAEIELRDCRVPEDARLPGAEGLGGPFACLYEARYGIVWGAMGAARSCYETALRYSKSREQFGKPIGAFQLTQEKLVNMLVEISKGTLLALHLGRMKDEGRLTPEQVSVGKLNNVREALEIARSARAILGANGITLEYPIMRHMNNLESVLTYEGTNEIHTLILGAAVTGITAFR